MVALIPMVYQTDPLTGEFIYALPANESPLEPGVYLLPAGATFTAPPTANTNQKQFYINGAWQLVADYRGQVIYSKTTKEENVQRTVGAVDDGWTLLKPGEFDTWQSDAWTYDETLDPASPTSAAVALKGDAQAALTASDVTVVRCMEDKMDVPQDHLDYRQTLRDIIAGRNPGPLPQKPSPPVKPQQ